MKQTNFKETKMKKSFEVREVAFRGQAVSVVIAMGGQTMRGEYEWLNRHNWPKAAGKSLHGVLLRFYPNLKEVAAPAGDRDRAWGTVVKAYHRQISAMLKPKVKETGPRVGLS